jgi:dolichol-phosphate mannosyltransferase
MSRHIQYSIVVPVYNEELVIQTTYQRLKEVMDQTKEHYELIFVNDGSKDRSIEILREQSLIDPRVKIIDFSRNFGHQIAITAGMDYAEGNAIAVIDADLQDPPELILDMIEQWKEATMWCTPSERNEREKPFSRNRRPLCFTGCCGA